MANMRTHSMESGVLLIKKKKLLGDLKGIKDTLVAAGDPFLAGVMNRAIACVENQTVVDAAPVIHGRWIEKQERIRGFEDDVDIYWVCSVCGATEIGKTNYCHNCGAKLDADKRNGLYPDIVIIDEPQEAPHG